MIRERSARPRLLHRFDRQRRTRHAPTGDALTTEAGVGLLTRYRNIASHACWAPTFMVIV